MSADVDLDHDHDHGGADVVGRRDRPRQGRRRRGLLVGAGLAVVLALAPAAVSAAASAVKPAPAAPKAAPAAAGVREPVCPTSTTPQDGGGYGVQVTAEITDITLYNGWNEQRQLWGSIAQNISAKACGLLRLPSLRVDIKPDGLVFDTSKANLTSPAGFFVPTDFALALVPTGPAANTLTGVRKDGALDLAATTPLKATVLPGSGSGSDFRCVTTANATLSTGPSTVVPNGRGPEAGPRQSKDATPWTVEGTPLTGKSLVGATATIAGNGFALPVFDDDPDGCGPSGFLLNIAFGGADAQGNTYYPGTSDYGPVHPAGTGWSIGTLRITGVDETAIPVAPPKPLQDAVVPACVPQPGPPFVLGVAGAFSGSGITIKDGVAISKIGGRLCGTATVVAAPPDHPGAKVCTHLQAPAAGQQFDSLDTSLTLVPGVTSVISKVRVAPEDLDAYFCDDDPDGQLVVKTTVRASAVPELFGRGCLGGPRAAPSTGTLSGPLGAAKVTLKSGPFRIDTVQPSASCPPGLASNTNTILGLPLPQTTDGLTIDTTAGLYLDR